MNEDLKPAHRKFPMQGVEVWKNPKNGFCVVELHYTADPSKRGPEWKQKTKQSMPIKKWLREYEISWDSWAGTPVFPDYDPAYHGVKGPIEPWLGLPLLRGWDFGLTPSCIIAQLQESRLMILKEFVAFNMGLERFLLIVLPQCQQLYRSWSDKKRDWVDIIDPSGNARKDTDEKSCADLMRLNTKEKPFGLSPVDGAISFEKRKESVEHFLTRRTKEGPCYQISLENCPLLAQGFRGGYQYPESTTSIEPVNLRPLKNKYSHVHDANQMVTSWLLKNVRGNHVDVPTPQYSWRGRQ